MKQQISIDQLNELNDDGKRRLEEWYNQQPYKFQVVAMDIVGITARTYKQGPLLSIGQMIEFLYDHQPDKRFKNGRPPTISFYQKKYEIDDYESQWWSITPEDLCDDLWEAVKEVLEDK